MITAPHRALRRLATMKQRYLSWELRVVDARFAGWSPKRRLVLFVWLPAMIALCCGGPLAVPVVWTLRATVAAGQGAATPDAAADEYLMRLSYGDDAGLLPLLDDEHQDDLIQQWRDYRAAMLSTDPPPFRLDFASLDLRPAAGDRAQVRVNVHAVWWSADENGRLGGYSSSPRTWVIETRNDNGWRVSHVNAPAWCGVGGYVGRCGRRIEPSAVPTSDPSTTPSSDPLRNPREMLRCGPRDPFRNMHSCSPSVSPEPATTPSPR
ncbi:hypothetical protein ACQP2F_45030 [Actinoplanes sp. CA-030573]|uniref:hypothetical protein n=1 Tax=Actinoplanes sp. CA-030573 TaxID=3239898 RepID=UPI003D8CBD12